LFENVLYTVNKVACLIVANLTLTQNYLSLIELIGEVLHTSPERSLSFHLKMNYNILIKHYEDIFD